MEKKAINLCGLLNEIKAAMKNTLPFSWWVMAEISEIKVNYSGHCYLELIEKNEINESIKARARATIWSSVYRMLQPYFETTTQTRLCAGIKVMVKVSAEFHEVYGFSLNITDIEPSYTVGELALQKLEIIRRLKAEGVFDMNRSLPFPDLPKRIAVISSKTAAGYGDFHDQITNNQFGYTFYLKLFPAVMQGEEAEKSIIKALESIYSHEKYFDAVVIIRGGGASADLHCFNSYWLNYNICQFPLPVITGIGHEQDETVADLVAHTRMKTPTAVAEFLIGCLQEAEAYLNEQTLRLYDLVSEKMSEENERLQRLILVLTPSVKKRLEKNRTDLLMRAAGLKGSVRHLIALQTGKTDRLHSNMLSATREYIKNEIHRIEMLEKQNNYLDPYLILKRGYSITYHKGKAVKSAAEISAGDIIETRLAEGTLKSKNL